MVHKRGRYQLLLGLLAVVALSPAEARVMADHEPVPQVIPFRIIGDGNLGRVEVRGKGASNYARSCKASAMNCEQRWINPDRGAANGCVQRVWELRDQYQRLCGGR
jgi:hypothetical protein